MSESDDDWLPIPEELVEKTAEKEEQTTIVRKLIFEVFEEALASKELRDDLQIAEQSVAGKDEIARDEPEILAQIEVLDYPPAAFVNVASA